MGRGWLPRENPSRGWSFCVSPRPLGFRFLTPIQKARSRICGVGSRKEQPQVVAKQFFMWGEESMTVSDSWGCSFNVLYNKLYLSHWTRYGPEGNGCLTQKTTEVFQIWVYFYAGVHSRMSETTSDLMCRLLGIPHCEEVHSLAKRYSGGISLETHSAVGHLYHWAVQRKRQGELLSVHCFALQVNVSIYVLSVVFTWNKK